MLETKLLLKQYSKRLENILNNFFNELPINFITELNKFINKLKSDIEKYENGL